MLIADILSPDDAAVPTARKIASILVSALKSNDRVAAIR